MASLLSCALLLAALCWAGGDTAATNPCDLDNGGRLKDCLEKVISLEKDKLDDRIDIPANSQDYQFVSHGKEYTFKDIHLTGVREFQVLELFYCKTGEPGFRKSLQHALRAHLNLTPSPNLLYITMKLKWTSIKLVMEVTQKSTSKTASIQVEVTFNTAAFPVSCYMKIINGAVGPSLQLDKIEKADLKLSVDKGSQGNIKLIPSDSVGPKEADAIKNAAYRTALSPKIHVALDFELNRWLLSDALPTLATSVKGKI